MKTNYVKIIYITRTLVRKRLTNTYTQRFCYLEVLYFVNADTIILIQA